MTSDSGGTGLKELAWFSPGDGVLVDGAVDRLMSALGGEGLLLLGLGEPTHGIEEPLALRNMMFRRLVEGHGFTAIAVESSFPRGVLVNDYAHGRVTEPFGVVREMGFSHGFGRPSTTRELVDWIRDYNAKAAGGKDVNFYGFDAPMEMMNTDAPRQSVLLALEAFEKLDGGAAAHWRARIEPLLGDDEAWSNAKANMDATYAVGDSAAARLLRGEVDGLVKAAWEGRYDGAEAGELLDARHFAKAAARLLEYHHAVATLAGDKRFGGMLALRDELMAENLLYIVEREKLRGGRVMVFAHNAHVQRGTAKWQWGSRLIEWRPAGSFADEELGSAYAVIATGAGAVPEFGIAGVEAGTIEAAMCEMRGPARAVLTRDLRASGNEFVVRTPNQRFFPLTPDHLLDFDAVVTFDEARLQRVDG